MLKNLKKITVATSIIKECTKPKWGVLLDTPCSILINNKGSSISRTSYGLIMGHGQQDNGKYRKRNKAKFSQTKSVDEISK